MKASSTSKRLKEIMSIKQLKQKDIVEMTKIPKSAISNYIKGYREPRQDRIDLLSKALNVSPAWLMGFDVPIDREKELTQEYEKEKIITFIKKLNEEDFTKLKVFLVNFFNYKD